MSSTRLRRAAASRASSARRAAKRSTGRPTAAAKRAQVRPEDAVSASPARDQALDGGSRPGPATRPPCAGAAADAAETTPSASAAAAWVSAVPVRRPAPSPRARHSVRGRRPGPRDRWVGGSGCRSRARRRTASSAAARCSAFACGVAVRRSGFEVAHPPGDVLGVGLARLPAPDPEFDHDAAVLAFPLLGDLRQPQAGTAERGRLPGIGVHLADDQLPVRVVGVVVRDHEREVVFEAECTQGAVGELELFASGRALTGRPRGGEGARTGCAARGRTRPPAV